MEGKLSEALRIARLEAEVVELKRALEIITPRALFGETVAGVAMFAVSRLAPVLVRAGIIPSGDDNLVSALHTIFLQMEQDKQWPDQSRKLARQWREALARDDANGATD